MLETVVILKAIVEVALFAFLGQGILYLLAGAKRDRNFVYGILKTLTSPFFRVARIVSPRSVLDRHLWMVVLFLLLVAWIALTFLKVRLILGGGSLS